MNSKAGLGFSFSFTMASSNRTAKAGFVPRMPSIFSYRAYSSAVISGSRSLRKEEESLMIRFASSWGRRESRRAKMSCARFRSKTSSGRLWAQRPAGSRSRRERKISFMARSGVEGGVAGPIDPNILLHEAADLVAFLHGGAENPGLADVAKENFVEVFVTGPLEQADV